MVHPLWQYVFQATLQPAANLSGISQAAAVAKGLPMTNLIDTKRTLPATKLNSEIETRKAHTSKSGHLRFKSKMSTSTKNKSKEFHFQHSKAQEP